MGRVNESSASYVNAKVKVKTLVTGAVKGEGATLSTTRILIQRVYQKTF